MEHIEKIVKNLSGNILIYTLFIIILGTLVGYYHSLRFLSNYVTVIVFLMIYPMMVNISFESLKKIRSSKKTIIIALFFNFILAPVLYCTLCIAFQVPSDIKISLLLLAVAPASSMGLGYVGLSKGNIVSASMIVALAFILSLVVYPITINLLHIGQQIVPINKIIESLIFVLVLPLLLGLITREGIIEKRGIDIKKVKPYFSMITLVMLYVLIFVIFALKGKLIVEHWEKVALITPIAIAFYMIMITLALILNKYLVKISYEENQAVVFTTVSKNVALTIGLLVTTFGKSGQLMAMYPAIISIFQIIFLMAYLRFSEHVLRWWIQDFDT